MKVLYIDEAKLAEAWPHAAPWIEKAVVRGGGDYPLQDAYADIEFGRKKLFKAINGKDFAWLLLGVNESSESKTAILFSIGGKGVFNFIEKLDEFCNAYAILNGCEHIAATGRRGWKEPLAKLGWKDVSVIYKKEVQYGR